MFNNQIFDNWLTKKSDEILSKVDREKITTEEMVLLILKSQHNRFDHIDEEFKKIDLRFEKVDQKFDEQRKDFKNMFIWQAGLLVVLFTGLYLKIYFN